MKNTKIITLALIVLGFAAGGWFYVRNFQNFSSSQTSHSACLQENEYADYPVDEKSNPQLKIPKEVPVIVSLRDRITNETKISFNIDNIRENYHPIELHKCGAYVIKLFNYNPKQTIQEVGYRAELYKYSYDGNDNGLLLFNEMGKNRIYKSYFSTDFRVDPTETYVALERKYLGDPEYALVIKNLNTKEDSFVFLYKDLLARYPFFVGNLGMNQWAKDGRYFWGNVFDGANVAGFFRVERDSWKVEVFQAPVGTMGGDALNPERGYITYDNGVPWTGDAELDRLNKVELQKQGLTKFYLYNLFIKKDILIATSTDPTHSFKPLWFSDTELEYTAPTGERKIYIAQ